MTLPPRLAIRDTNDTIYTIKIAWNSNAHSELLSVGPAPICLLAAARPHPSVHGWLGLIPACSAWSNAAQGLDATVAMCRAIRKAAFASKTEVEDLRTVARFVGKVQLILEGLRSVEGLDALRAWPEAHASLQDALQGVADVVDATAAMGSLQAVLVTEDTEVRLGACLKELGSALAELAACAGDAPPDVAQDTARVPRQIAGATFAPRPGTDLLTWQLLRGLTLAGVGRGDRAALGAQLRAALRLVSLGREGLGVWLEREVLALRAASVAARAAGDVVLAFFCHQVLMCLLAAGTGAWDWLEEPVAGEGCAQDGAPLANPSEAAEALASARTTPAASACLGEATPPGQGTPPGAGKGSGGAEGQGVSEEPLSRADEGRASSNVMAHPVADLTDPADIVDGASPGPAPGNAPGKGEAPGTPPRAAPGRAGEGPGSPVRGAARLLGHVAAWFAGMGGGVAGPVPRSGLPLANALSLDLALGGSGALGSGGHARSEGALPNGCAAEEESGPPPPRLPGSAALSRSAVAALASDLRADGWPDAELDFDADDVAGAVAALASPSLLRQWVAAVALEAGAEAGGELWRAAAAALGLVPATLRALRGARDPALRGVLAGVLRQLARDTAQRRAVAEAGGIAVLAGLLQSPSSHARQAAARALSNVVVNSGKNKLEAAQFGAIHSLARMLETDGAMGREAAAATLGNLAANCEATSALLAEAGAVAPLADLLASGTPMAVQHAARALRNLAGRDGRNKRLVLEAGAAPRLTRLLGSRERGAAQAAASALSNLACNCEAAQDAVVAAGAVPGLLSLLAAFEDGDSADPSAAAAAEAAAWALSNLCGSEGARRAVCAEAGAILGPVVAALSGGSPGARHAAARLLKALVAGDTSAAWRREAIAAGAAVPLVELLDATAEGPARAAAAAITALASRSATARREFARCGAAAPLARALARTGSGAEALRAEAARAVGALAAPGEGGVPRELVDAGAAASLVALLGSRRPGAGEAAAAALGALARAAPGARRALLGLGALDALLGLLTPACSQATQAAAAAALGALACEDEAEAVEAAAPRAAALLAETAAHGLPATARAAAATLSDLACCGGAVRAAVASSRAPRVLVALVRSPLDELRAAAALALWDLCFDCEAGRLAVLNADGAPCLVQVLLIGGEEAKEAAAACLGELAALGPRGVATLRACDAVTSLEALAVRGAAPRAVALAALNALRAIEANGDGAGPTEEGGEEGGVGPAASRVSDGGLLASLAATEVL
ncbi:hypothetical protein ACKKBG_A26715 [Auxenochlorella protothecoides x Auxenochlorella symbiontica]